MKRTPLKRRTPLRRARFRREDAELCSDSEQREHDVVVSGNYLVAVERPVGRTRFGASRREQKRAKRLTRYARRERFPEYMLWVKAQPCLLAHHGCCMGVVEADHAGDRGVGQKSHDNTCIPLCHKHHVQRHDLKGYFYNFGAQRMREWRHAAVEATQRAARLAGVEVPS